jgi:hypothetical protein
LSSGRSGALQVVAGVVTSRFGCTDVSQGEGDNQTSEIFDHALITTEEKAHAWSGEDNHHGKHENKVL